MEDLRRKSKFNLFYFAKPWPQFEATILEACEEAERVSKTHSGVKLIEVDICEINFQEILNMKRGPRGDDDVE